MFFKFLSWKFAWKSAILLTESSKNRIIGRTYPILMLEMTIRAEIIKNFQDKKSENQLNYPIRSPQRQTQLFSGRNNNILCGKVQLHMNLLHSQMLNRKEYLEKLQTEIEQALKHSPHGKLRVSNDRGKPRYYQITDAKDTHGRYLSKKERDLACGLAQKDYMQRLYQQVKEELADIEMYIVKYSRKNLERAYDELNEYRRNIVVPMVVSDELFAKRWELEPYETNPYYPEEKVYSTKKDEFVRSKSEVLLADMYYELAIPYRYEAKLQLTNGKIKYPDFTILKTGTREVIYHEHLGLLDDEEYRQANFMKLDEYRRNGIFPGKNLIITYETAGCYLNMKEIKKMVQEIVRI